MAKLKSATVSQIGGLAMWTFTAYDLFNITLRPGLIMPQTSDDWLLAYIDAHSGLAGLPAP